jgi:hypothetical protein
MRHLQGRYFQVALVKFERSFWMEGETLAEGFEKVKKIQAICPDARVPECRLQKIYE